MRQASTLARPMVLAAWIAVGGTACTAPRPAPPAPARVATPEASNPEDVVGRLVSAHNAERARKRLPPLDLNPELAEAARLHARDMAARGKMSHSGGDRSSPFERMARAGYRYGRAGENVAAGQPDVEAVMSAWMKSTGHRRNILGDYSEVGAACATARDGTTYWCATFGRPAAR